MNKYVELITHDEIVIFLQRNLPPKRFICFLLFWTFTLTILCICVETNYTGFLTRRIFFYFFLPFFENTTLGYSKFKHVLCYK